MVAGAMAGVAEHCVMFPMDTVKTRMQVAGSVETSLVETARSVSPRSTGFALALLFAPVRCIPCLLLRPRLSSLGFAQGGRVERRHAGDVSRCKCSIQWMRSCTCCLLQLLRGREARARRRPVRPPPSGARGRRSSGHTSARWADDTIRRREAAHAVRRKGREGPAV